MNKKIGIIGAGRIGRAIIKGLLNCGFDPNSIIASVRTKESAKKVEEMNVKFTFDNYKVVNEAELIIIALKPLTIIENSNILKMIASEKVIVSVAAFLPLSFYKKFTNNNEIYRAMPNVNVEINRGYTALYGEKGENSYVVEKLFGLLGEVDWVSEDVLDKLTLISASSPAIIAEIIDAMEIAAMYSGIPPNIARKAIISVLEGTANLAKNKDILSIRNSIVTPKGITSKLIRKYLNMNIKSSIVEIFIQASEELEQTISKIKMDYKI